ncbi:aminotransferase class I/II-fold pyridoxal phosphate-dependent enzyme [Mycolicibacterium farcinogenes]|nr:aminotransferase class I/II-fold pyridoxal phosphate-dependent enzyme [Mycolicibacterium farcinogenes]
MIAVSPTAIVRQRAAELRRQGRPVHDLSAGELDLPTPGHIVDAAAAAAALPENHHYGATAGTDSLRQAVAERLGARSPGPVDAASVVITHGDKQALFNTFSAVLQPGDEVLVPAPYWVTFPATIRLAGGEPVIVAPDPATLKVTPEALEAASSSATTSLLVCSPNNPTGLAYTEAEFRALLSWAADRGIRVISDETYVDLSFGELSTPAEVEPRIADRLVRVGSVSKSFAMTGWRVGWLAGPAEIVKRATAVQSHTTGSVCGINQAAALAALTGPDVTSGFREILRGRLSRCRAVLGPAGLMPHQPDGAFYVFADVRSIDPDDAVVAERLAQHGVITVPGSSFGTPGWLRLSYAVADDHLAAGLNHIVDLIAEGSKQP